MLDNKRDAHSGSVLVDLSTLDMGRLVHEVNPCDMPQGCRSLGDGLMNGIFPTLA
jgi:hypothetical protein